MVEEEFLSAVEKFKKHYTAFTMDRGTVTGDIILRRNELGKAMQSAIPIAPSSNGTVRSRLCC